MIFRPCHASDWRWNWKFVANGFFLSPLSSYFIYEDNVITLSNCNLGGVGRKLESSNKIRFLALIWWLCRKLIFFLSKIIKEIYSLNKEKETLSAEATASFLPLLDQAMAETFFMPSSNFIILDEYLKFIQNLNKCYTIFI